MYVASICGDRKRISGVAKGGLVTHGMPSIFYSELRLFCLSEGLGARPSGSPELDKVVRGTLPPMSNALKIRSRVVEGTLVTLMLFHLKVGTLLEVASLS